MKSCIEQCSTRQLWIRMTRVLRKTRRCFHRKGILPALFAVLCWMLVGVGLQLRLLQLWQTQMNYSFPALTNSTSSSKEPKYAYAFYATSSSYACGAFVNIAALRDSGSPSTIDFVLLYVKTSWMSTIVFISSHSLTLCCAFLQDQWTSQQRSRSCRAGYKNERQVEKGGPSQKLQGIQ